MSSRGLPDEPGKDSRTKTSSEGIVDLSVTLSGEGLILSDREKVALQIVDRIRSGGSRAEVSDRIEAALEAGLATPLRKNQKARLMVDGFFVQLGSGNNLDLVAERIEFVSQLGISSVPRFISYEKHPDHSILVAQYAPSGTLHPIEVLSDSSVVPGPERTLFLQGMQQLLQKEDSHPQMVHDFACQGFANWFHTDQGRIVLDGWQSLRAVTSKDSTSEILERFQSMVASI